jgi:hypothetical protein
MCQTPGHLGPGEVTLVQRGDNYMPFKSITVK